MKIVIFGAGAWGTAMACYCHRIGHCVTIVPKFEDQAVKMIAGRENVDFLPGIGLAEGIEITVDVASGLANKDLALLACPAIGMEDLCMSLLEASRKMPERPILISLCKGIQNDNFEMASDLISRILPSFECGVLAGPTNAREIADGKNAAMVLATRSRLVYKLQEALNSEQIRIYSSGDVKGAELGGCLKNVYAIGSGICDGLKLGDNTRAAYLTRSLKELVEIGVALGGQPETFYGLSGFGDFVATCTGSWSRNRTFGEKLAMGQKIDAIFSSQKSVVEGYRTTKAFYEICEKIGLEAPILCALYAFLYRGRSLGECIGALLNRSLKAESRAHGGGVTDS